MDENTSSGSNMDIARILICVPFDSSRLNLYLLQLKIQLLSW